MPVFSRPALMEKRELGKEVGPRVTFPHLEPQRSWLAALQVSP